MALTISDDANIGSGRSAARLACLLRKQEVGSSNLLAPTTKSFRAIFFRNTFRNIFRNPLITLLVWVILMVGLPAMAETPITYKVVSGDNLTFIAKRFGITLSGLKKANRLSSDLLSIGQILHLDDPFQKPLANKIKWAHPCLKTGKTLRPFGKYKEKEILMARTGIDLACPKGSSVRAPATGVVRYIGPLDGFGIVMILEHGNGYSTVFSPLQASSIKVRKGRAINQGSILGRTAQPVLDNSLPYLHIELRKDKIAINPNPLHP